MKKAVLLLALSLWGCSASTEVTKGSLGGLTFLDAQHGWAVGSGEKDKLFTAYTQDGGEHWEAMQIPGGNTRASLHGVAFRDATHGWAVGSHGLAFSTQDGGKNWQKIDPAGDANGIEYRQGLGCAVYGAPGYALVSGFLVGKGEDFPKGRPKTQLRTGRLFNPWGAKIVDSNTITGYGSSELYLTSDAGLNWTVVGLRDDIKDSLCDISFTSARQGWIACGDGSLLFTNDGGLTRAALSTVGLEGRILAKIHFFDDFQGVGLAKTKDSGCLILASADGGKTWKKKLDLGEGNWNQLEVLDRTHAWVGGRVKDSVYVRAFSP